MEVIAARDLSSVEPVASISCDALLDVHAARSILVENGIQAQLSAQIPRATLTSDVDIISTALAIARAKKIECFHDYINALPSVLPGLQWFVFAAHHMSIVTAHGYYFAGIFVQTATRPHPQHRCSI